MATALAAIPQIASVNEESSGEGCLAHSGAAWKRVLQYRAALLLKPASILETHAGRGVGSNTYLQACPSAIVTACRVWERELLKQHELFDLIDIDPYGKPEAALEAAVSFAKKNALIFVTSGETHQARRGFSGHKKEAGHAAARWADSELRQSLEGIAGRPCVFAYHHPHMSRFILSHRTDLDAIWAGCPRALGWFKEEDLCA